MFIFSNEEFNSLEEKARGHPVFKRYSGTIEEGGESSKCPYRN